MPSVQGTLHPARAYRHCPPRSAGPGAAAASQLHTVTYPSGFSEKDKKNCLHLQSWEQLREKDRHPRGLCWLVLCWAVPGAEALGSGVAQGDLAGQRG